MIRVIVGKKGTGKTRKVIDMANQSANLNQGNIVFIDGGSTRSVELNRGIRFINANEYEISDLRVFYGFLCGMIAEDYDIYQIYIDGLLGITQKSLEEVEKFLFDVKKLSDRFNVRFIITMNGDPDSIPAFLKAYIA